MRKAGEVGSIVQYWPDPRFGENAALGQLWYLLGRTRDVVYRMRRRDLGQMGLTAEQSMVLSIISTLVNNGLADKATPAEISRQMFRESQSVSELLHRMERDGLVVRVKDLERKNMVRVELAKKGREQLQASVNSTSIVRVMSRLTPEQRQQFATCLDIIREAALNELGAEDVPMAGGLDPQDRKRARGHAAGKR